MQETKSDTSLISRLGRSLGEGNGSPSSLLAWRIPWTEEPGGLQSIESQRVWHDWSDWTCTHTCSDVKTPRWSKNKRSVFLIQLKLKKGVPDQQWLISRWCLRVLISSFYHLEQIIIEISVSILIKETEGEKKAWRTMQGRFLWTVLKVTEITGNYISWKILFHF